jgi:hypothetical protein
MQELCKKTMEEFKSSDSRLARLFYQSRDKWKKKALQKQKKIRALEVKVRDLSDSRDYWKNRARVAEEKLNEQKRETGDEETKKLEQNSSAPK